MNKGEIRIILSSTLKMATGVNVQKKCIAGHFLTLTWTPKDIEQAMGRYQRQGNEFSKVHTFIYATNKMLDLFKFDILRKKNEFISKIKNNEGKERSIEENSFDEDGINFAQFTAIVSGNPLLLEHRKIKEEIKNKKIEEEIVFLEKIKTAKEIDKANEKLIRFETFFKEIILDKKNYILPEIKEKNQYNISVLLNKKIINTNAEISKEIRHIEKEYFSKLNINPVHEKKTETILIGKINDLNIFLEIGIKKASLSTETTNIFTEKENEKYANLILTNVNNILKYTNNKNILKYEDGYLGRTIYELYEKIPKYEELYKNEILNEENNKKKYKTRKIEAENELFKIEKEIVLFEKNKTKIEIKIENRNKEDNNKNNKVEEKKQNSISI